jgi:5-methylcytosine-specific restriction endonuclease McrA
MNVANRDAGGDPRSPPVVSRTEAEMILRRQNNRCAVCGRRLGTYCEEVDFIVPPEEGGSLRARNMQVLCPVCHRSKVYKDLMFAKAKRGNR